MRKLLLVFAAFACISANAQFKANKVHIQAPRVATVAEDIPDESVDVGYCSSLADELLAVGVGGEAELSLAIQVPVSELKSKGSELFMVKFALASNDIRDLTVWVRNDLVADVEPMVSIPVTDAHVGWNYVFLDSPLSLEGLVGDLYIGYTLTTAGYTIAVEETGQSNTMADWAWVNGTASHLTESVGKVACAIKAQVSGGDYSGEDTQMEVTPAELTGKAYVATGTGFVSSVELRNYGIETVRDVEVSYKVGEVMKTETYTGVAIVYGMGLIVELPETVFDAEGVYPLEVTVAKVNGRPNPAAATKVSGEVNVLQEGTFTERHLLIEQFTGQYCQYCPGGHNAIDFAIDGIRDRVTWVSNYFYDGSSGDFYIPEDKTISSSYGIRSAPMCMLDRTNISGYSSTNSPGFNAQNVTYELLLTMLEKPSYVSVELDGLYDKEKNAIEVTVSGKFYKDLPDAKLNVFLVEDGFVSFQYHNRYGQIEDYEHDHVLRAVLSNNVMGDEITLDNDRFEAKYTYVIPEIIAKMATNPENMKVVAFVGDFVSGAQNNSPVHNTTEMVVKDFPAGTVTVGVNTNVLSRMDVYGGHGMVCIEGNYDDACIYTVDGMEVPNGNLASGLYIVKVVAGKDIMTRKVMVK